MELVFIALEGELEDCIQTSLESGSCLYKKFPCSINLNTAWNAALLIGIALIDYILKRRKA